MAHTHHFPDTLALVSTRLSLAVAVEAVGLHILLAVAGLAGAADATGAAAVDEIAAVVAAVHMRYLQESSRMALGLDSWMIHTAHPRLQIPVVVAAVAAVAVAISAAAGEVRSSSGSHCHTSRGSNSLCPEEDMPSRGAGLGPDIHAAADNP